MAKKKKEAAEEIELVDHVITQEDLDANPDLVLQGIEVGETVQLPAEISDTPEDAEELIEEEVKELGLASELPEWARSKGVEPTKEEVSAFKAPEINKPVNRDEEIPEWMKA